MTAVRIACENLNHRRTDAPVRHCPACGVVVNERVPIRSCSEAQHATARRHRSAFCIDCGVRLVASR